jgi:hypothetical protein
VQALLGEIAADPLIASYIIHADLGGPTGPDVDPLSDKPLQGISDALAPLVKGSKHLAALSDAPDFKTTWLRNIVEDNDEWGRPFDYPVAFLLSLLTNVESLVLPGKWHGHSVSTREEEDDLYHSVSDLVHLLVTRANDTELIHQPLQKLHTLHPMADVCNQSGTDMECIFPFLALDSLRQVQHELGVYEPGEEGCAQYPTLGKQVEVLKLYDYVMSDNGAAILFKDMHHLRVLELVYCMKDEIGYNFRANGFLFWLKRLVGGHLEELVLTGNQVWPDTELIKTSMRKFKVLSHLVLSMAFFVNSTEGEESEEEDTDDNTDGEGIGEDNGGEEREHKQDKEDAEGEQEEQENAEDEQEEQEDTQIGEDGDEEEYDTDDDYESDGTWRLVDKLPRSLRTLKILAAAAERDCRFLEKMFDGFDDERGDCLPLLEEVEICMGTRDCWGDELDDFQQYLDRAAAYFDSKGVEFSFF